LVGYFLMLQQEYSKQKNTLNRIITFLGSVINPQKRLSTEPTSSSKRLALEVDDAIVGQVLKVNDTMNQLSENLESDKTNNENLNNWNQFLELESSVDEFETLFQDPIKFDDKNSQLLLNASKDAGLNQVAKAKSSNQDQSQLFSNNIKSLSPLNELSTNFAQNNQLNMFLNQIFPATTAIEPTTGITANEDKGNLSKISCAPKEQDKIERVQQNLGVLEDSIKGLQTMISQHELNLDSNLVDFDSFFN
jgi:hypothetical protein